ARGMRSASAKERSMGEYDDDYRPSVDERLRQGASDELEVVRLRAENERLRKNQALLMRQRTELSQICSVLPEREEAHRPVEHVRMLVAENERLKGELAEASARADEHADRLDVYWKETAAIKAQLRE